MRSHNIVGSEAPLKRGMRDLAFAPSHGTILELRRRGRFPRIVVAFAAGVLAAIALAAFLSHR